jgi:hypothetical protein
LLLAELALRLAEQEHAAALVQPCVGARAHRQAQPRKCGEQPRRDPLSMTKHESSLLSVLASCATPA